MLTLALRRMSVLRGAARFASTATIKLPEYEVFNLDKSALPKTASTTSDEMLRYYREMNFQRRVEIMCDEIYKKKEVRGFCHLMDGQEAVSVGVEAGITKDDHLITAYRCHGVLLGRGETADRLLAEMMGKSTGASKGKGGSMHMSLRKNKFYGGNGIVGAHIPLGAGIAFGINYEKKKEVCVTMYGDSASNQGQLFEAANMALLWKLPIIYLCENNLYAMGTACARATPNTKYYTKLAPIPGIKGDGMDLFAVREIIKFAREWCLSGKGPICLELETYRYHGHSMSDPGLSYRSREEIAQVRKERDPIAKVKKIILDNKLATEDELKEIEKETRKVVDDVTLKAREAPWPDPEKDLLTDVMAEPDPHPFIRNVEYDKSIFP
uniref:Pyruvate dehydrogenase E1 component subunit alpha n=2 Tax=Nyctotherus ovalis TaxID=70075 RepID=Q1EGI1_NYCOV|nr:pyruvate dehydrogenase E1 alpha subunit [Nyctotherus ovalis]